MFQGGSGSGLDENQGYETKQKRCSLLLPVAHEYFCLPVSHPVDVFTHPLETVSPQIQSSNANQGTLNAPTSSQASRASRDGATGSPSLLFVVFPLLIGFKLCQLGELLIPPEHDASHHNLE